MIGPRDRGEREIRAGSIDSVLNYMRWPAAGNLGLIEAEIREGETRS